MPQPVRASSWPIRGVGTMLSTSLLSGSRSMSPVPARARGPAITLGVYAHVIRSAKAAAADIFAEAVNAGSGRPPTIPPACRRQPNPAHLQERGIGAAAGPGQVKAVRMMRVGWDFGPWQGVRLVCSDQYMFVSAEALAELGFPAAAAGLADLARARLLARPAPSGPPQASPPRMGTVPGQAPPMNRTARHSHGAIRQLSVIPMRGPASSRRWRGQRATRPGVRPGRLLPCLRAWLPVWPGREGLTT
jgi:hypothetical protein